MAFKRANKPTPYNTLGKKPKKFKKYGKRGGWRPKKGK